MQPDTVEATVAAEDVGRLERKLRPHQLEFEGGQTHERVDKHRGQDLRHESKTPPCGGMQEWKETLATVVQL